MTTKTAFGSALVFFLLVLSMVPLTVQAAVEMPDSALRAMFGYGPNDEVTAEALLEFTSLYANGAGISDLTGLEYATNLMYLGLADNNITDISALSGLTNLTNLAFRRNNIADISALSGLTNLTDLNLWGNNITDISALSGLTNLTVLYLSDTNITDISALSGLTNLTVLYLSDTNITDISALSGLTNLTVLGLWNNNITDISALSGLTNLTLLELSYTNITDISALSGLTNLTELYLSGNNIADISALSGLTNLTVLYLSDNNIADISALSGLTNLTELYLSGTNITDIAPLVENGGLDSGDVVDVQVNPLSEASINTHIPQLENRGVEIRYSLIPAQVSISGAVVNVGDTFSISLAVDSVTGIAGWELSALYFSSEILSAVSVQEGDFLKQDGVSTFFQQGTIDNTAGAIQDVSAVRLGGSVSGAGELLSITFEAKIIGETLTGGGLLLLDADGEEIPYEWSEEFIVIENRSGDVNGDGEVNILDLVLVAQGAPGSDINGDGVTNIIDLVLVAQQFAGAAAPGASPTHQTIQHWIDMARAADDGSPAFRRGIANLKRLLLTAVPDTTALLHNYPNPFNPETWIPYQLSSDSPVSVSIYDKTGVLVRTLSLGMQSAGFYNSRSRAAYWDGRNDAGERVASGLYFYQLRTPSFHQTRRLVVVK